MQRQTQTSAAAEMSDAANEADTVSNVNGSVGSLCTVSRYYGQVPYRVGYSARSMKALHCESKKGKRDGVMYTTQDEYRIQDLRLV